MKERVWQVGLIVVVLVAFWLGNAIARDPGIPDVIQARRFEVVDKSGRVQIRMATGECGGMIIVYDSDGTERAFVFIDMVGVADSKGHSFASMGESDGVGAIMLFGPGSNHKAGIALFVPKDTSPFAMITGDDGERTWRTP